MSLHFDEDHGALHDCKAQFNRGLAVLGRKQSMLLPQSAADVYRAGCAAKEGIPHRSIASVKVPFTQVTQNEPPAQNSCRH
ncbi:hypothetical protein [Bradyrhizobium sp. 160]|uniref:hypothetical protein n=1 Tax=Bradyrhizobium sp. 160 TaxID=2782634 RepID=UPI001FF9916B|nr:hypothetical protein [Bradyrhizobium sp. 160]